MTGMSGGDGYCKHPSSFGGLDTYVAIFKDDTSVRSHAKPL
jgi:hypothetical protein